MIKARLPLFRLIAQPLVFLFFKIFLRNKPVSKIIQGYVKCSEISSRKQTKEVRSKSKFGNVICYCRYSMPTYKNNVFA